MISKKRIIDAINVIEDIIKNHDDYEVYNDLTDEVPIIEAAKVIKGHLDYLEYVYIRHPHPGFLRDKNPSDNSGFIRYKKEELIKDIKQEAKSGKHSLGKLRNFAQLITNANTLDELHDIEFDYYAYIYPGIEDFEDND